MSVRKAIGALVITTFIGGGTAFSYKRTLISKRKSELDLERASLEGELRKALEKAGTIDADEREALQVVENRRSAFKTLWEDRLSRYEQGNIDAAAYLKALPEALGATKGLVNHYRYMTEELRHFVGFDIASSKVHNYGLLMKGAHENGIVKVAASLSGLFASEPLIGEVCNSVDVLQVTSVPKTLADVSETFVICLEDLEAVIEAASHDVVSRMTKPHQPESVASHATELLLEFAKVSTKSNAEMQIEATSKAVDKEILREQRRLSTREDINDAIQFADQLIRRVMSTTDGSTEAVRRHPSVQAAAKQVRVWQEGAVVFLAQDQAVRALESYNQLLALSLANSSSA